MLNFVSVHVQSVNQDYLQHMASLDKTGVYRSAENFSTEYSSEKSVVILPKHPSTQQSIQTVPCMHS